MGNVYLLDCTLRDGGYINDWAFGKDTLNSVFERLVSAGVDVIELGFLDARRPFDPDRSIMPDTGCMERIYGKVDKGGAMVVGMIDYGACPLENLQPCRDSYLDGIRVIFKKHRMAEALDFCKQVKALGYKVFIQAVSITSYSDEELLELAEGVNRVGPFAMAMVDTYGLLHQSNLMHIFEALDANLDEKICMAYHAHNNFQLGYANGIEILNTGVKRDLLVDGSLYGMGKSAGNAPVELLAMYLNEGFGKGYDVSQLLEAIEVNILDIYRKTPWGYNFFYFVAAANKCHPNYVSYLMEKRTLSIKSIQEILQRLEGESKLLYDQKRIESLYLDYQLRECDDSASLEALKKALRGKGILALGPGPSIVDRQGEIAAYIERERPVVFALNFLPKGLEERVDYVFLTNAKRYAQMAAALTEREGALTIIATSNVTKTQGKFAYVLNYGALIDPATEIPDNSLIMLLRALRAVGAERVALAGFDGYRADEMNYYKTNIEYSFAREKADYLNGYAKAYLRETAKDLPVVFVTPSRYEEE